MSMVCPQCLGSFSQRLHCPACGVRLEYRAGAPKAAAAAGDVHAWQQTPWGRIVIGLLLAQGLYYGLLHLCKALAMAVDPEAAREVWSTLTGLLLLQGLQAVGLLSGGALAGAGKRQGAVYAALVGLANGLISVAQVHSNAQLYSPVLLYGQPILHAAIGSLGGLVGLLIWRPLAPVAMPAGTVVGTKPAPRRRDRSVLGGPIAWFRVLAGSGVALGGALWASAILDLVLDAGEGKLSIDSNLQAHLITWEITVLALLAGGAWAGAATTNGLKQGLCVGLATSTALCGIRLAGKSIHIDTLASTVIIAMLFCILGGWFGGHLFPPLGASFGRRRFRSAAI
jgi:hypothetical protein